MSVVLPDQAISSPRMILSSEPGSPFLPTTVTQCVKGNNGLARSAYVSPLGIIQLNNNDWCFVPIPFNSGTRFAVNKLLVFNLGRADFNMRDFRAPVAGVEIGRANWQAVDAATQNGLSIMQDRLIYEAIGAAIETGRWEKHLLGEGTLIKVLVANANATKANLEILVKEIAADPAVANLEDGYAGIFKNTTSAAVFLAMNDGGVIKKVALV